MKIAVPTMDGTTLSMHFGKSRAFLVFEFEGGTIRSREERENPRYKGPAQGSLQDPQHAHSHDHHGLAALLGDCQAVIVRGMGAGAARAMDSAGIRVCMIQEDCTPEEAVSAFASGRLGPQQGRLCGCQGY